MPNRNWRKLDERQKSMRDIVVTAEWEISRGLRPEMSE